MPAALAELAQVKACVRAARDTTDSTSDDETMTHGATPAPGSSRARPSCQGVRASRGSSDAQARKARMYGSWDAGGTSRPYLPQAGPYLP
ncbi:hypothetical protein [Streptomyces sp. NPDC008125]|uniref:hypothetical protein n=1 Tax=Streptomyces sp. NPDC008125 TaxID=3364811 RepID=UPI0036E9CE0A